MFRWLKEFFFPVRMRPPADYSYEKHGAWPPALYPGPKGPVPPSAGYAHGRFRGVEVRYVDLPAAGLGPSYVFHLMTPVGKRPKKGQFVSDGTGNIRFHKSDAGRVVRVRYELNGKLNTKILFIPNRSKK